MLAEHRGDLPPAVNPAQLDLSARHKTEEKDQGCVFAWQRALRLHAAPEFLVEPLNHVCGAERLPLRLREAEEREKFVAAFSEARHHARAALAPRALEGAVGDTRSVSAGRVDDAMKVVADLVQGMLRRFSREIAQLVDAAALDGNPRPDEADGASQPRIT